MFHIAGWALIELVSGEWGVVWVDVTGAIWTHLSTENSKDFTEVTCFDKPMYTGKEFQMKEGDQITVYGGIPNWEDNLAALVEEAEQNKKRERDDFIHRN